MRQKNLPQIINPSSYSSSSGMMATSSGVPVDADCSFDLACMHRQSIELIAAGTVAASFFSVLSAFVPLLGQQCYSQNGSDPFAAGSRILAAQSVYDYACVAMDQKGITKEIKSAFAPYARLLEKQFSSASMNNSNNNGNANKKMKTGHSAKTVSSASIDSAVIRPSMNHSACNDAVHSREDQKILSSSDDSFHSNATNQQESSEQQSFLGHHGSFISPDASFLGSEYQSNGQSIVYYDAEEGLMI